MSTQPTTQLLEDASEILDEIESNFLGVRQMEGLATQIEKSLAESDFETLQGLVNNGNAMIAQHYIHAEDLV